MSETANSGKQVVQEIEIDASAEAVWKALVEAEELARWFPLDATVEPREGGLMSFNWGEQYPEMGGIISVFRPQKHLQIDYSHPKKGEIEPWSEMVTDYFITTQEGKTVLRLVQSGYGTGESWDDFYDATRRGWHFELRSLRNYLENHLGEDRYVIWILRHLKTDGLSAWEKLCSNEGFALNKFIASAKEGDRYEINLPGGDHISGIVQVAESPHQFGGTMDNMNRGLLRISLDPHEMGQTAQVFVSTYGIDDKTNSSLEKHLTEIMDDLFS